jgi:TPR repeat protein
MYEEAKRAFARGDVGRVRELLETSAIAGDRDAQASLGTILTLDGLDFVEGVRWLMAAAEAGHGLAAHNLATALGTGGPGVPADLEQARRFMRLAVDRGFEATVSTDPSWWRPSTR